VDILGAWGHPSSAPTHQPKKSGVAAATLEPSSARHCSVDADRPRLFLKFHKSARILIVTAS